MNGDLAWLLIASALVMLMIPGVGLFYGGMVRYKNAISMISLSIIALVIVSIQWVLIGYTLSFGEDFDGIIGELEYLGLKNIELSNLGFVAFQLMFGAITLAILTSAMAERVKMSSFILFGILWTTLVYDPIAHWVWGNGWLAKIGALDFAGGTVVHISSGFGALALAFLIGRRIGYGQHTFEPNNVPLALLGAVLLWFGWFGFNAGSALAANEIACNAFLATNTAAASGALSWMVVSWMKGRPSSLGIASGALAGLVAVTPAAGYVSVTSSILIGAIAGALCYSAMMLRIKMKIDESLDAWAVHGVGGFWGALATGIFAEINAEGLIVGNAEQVAVQLIGALGGAIYAFTMTAVLFKIVDTLMGFRVSEEAEYVGLDISQHGEMAYSR